MYGDFYLIATIYPNLVWCYNFFVIFIYKRKVLWVIDGVCVWGGEVGSVRPWPVCHNNIIPGYLSHKLLSVVRSGRLWDRATMRFFTALQTSHKMACLWMLRQLIDKALFSWRLKAWRSPSTIDCRTEGDEDEGLRIVGETIKAKGSEEERSRRLGVLFKIVSRCHCIATCYTPPPQKKEG